jgi:hypothetical protein
MFAFNLMKKRRTNGVRQCETTAQLYAVLNYIILVVSEKKTALESVFAF